ncbi:MAG: IS66 family transposase, partial [Burkholderiales bacterium]|nr:IS66 family transposase [Burkholderiales bacterium]
MPEEEQAPRDAADLPQTLSECHEVITQQAVQLSQLQEQVGVLQERLKLDSTNSSKPP